MFRSGRSLWSLRPGILLMAILWDKIESQRGLHEAPSTGFSARAARPEAVLCRQCAARLLVPVWQGCDCRGVTDREGWRVLVPTHSLQRGAQQETSDRGR